MIIQTIRQDPSGSDQIDDPSNVSRPDRSGSDQIDAEHQATDLAVGGSNPSRRAKRAGQRLSSKASSEHRILAMSVLACLGSSHGWCGAPCRRRSGPVTAVLWPRWGWVTP